MVIILCRHVYSGQQTSTLKQNIHDLKVVLCIWWDLIYNELLKPEETNIGDQYREQLIKLNRAPEENRPQFAERHHEVIFQHDNARPHVAKPVQNIWEYFDGKFFLTRRAP